MTNEVNELLKDTWFIAGKFGLTHLEHTSELASQKCAGELSVTEPQAAPYTSVRLQVKGTLPEGAVMPKYKVGDRMVAKHNQETYIVESIDVAYRMRGQGGVFAEANISPARSSDPLRLEFEKAWVAYGMVNLGLIKEQAYLGFKLAKGAK